MSRLLRSRYLACFYCGRKNSTQYDGRIRRFECPYCDATNYLDENGDITDPPVATEKEATPRQYAVSRAVSPPSSPTSNSTFCATCLKNQHLLSASLAQYLPDPDDPDYAEREKGLYRFRKNQERLYPQICSECEPRVRQRLEQAAYTAKTDLLRRMLDRSASASKSMTTSGWLERFDTAGKWLWIAGFVLQLTWHAVVVHGLFLQYLLWAGVDESLFTFQLLRICAPAVGSLPSAERLLGWSTLASILGAWWNPRVAQISRGFTRHISGVTKWYFFQAIAVVMRICLQRMDLTTPDPLLLNKHAAGHALATAIALLVFTVAPRAIRVNMAPLFGTTSSPRLQLPDSPDPSPATRLDETKSIADLLDEISRSPTSTTPPSPVDVSPSIPRRTNNFLPMGHAHTQAARTLTAHLQQIDHLNLSQPQPQPHPRPASSYEEMDWSPTPISPNPPTSLFTNTNPLPLPPGEQQQQVGGIGIGSKSKHRAFATQGQRATQPFGSAPTEPRKGPFWYRVPPAPTTPAQRVFNPPNQPRLRGSPVEGLGQGQGQELRGGGGGGVGVDSVRFRKTAAGGGGGIGNRNGGGGFGRDGGGQQQPRELQQVAFAEPSFFAERVVGGGVGSGSGGQAGRSDPRNELSGMFGEAFKLDGEEKRARERDGWLSRVLKGRGDGKKA